jgi:hypothetical protein
MWFFTKNNQPPQPSREELEKAAQDELNKRMNQELIFNLYVNKLIGPNKQSTQCMF